MPLDERKLAVLRAIVEDFVDTREPVGSRHLVERRSLGVSAATVRNDMAALEDEGYITQPHTSAGRIPTDRGYRLFVDRLSTVKPLSAAERRAIERFLTGSVDLDDVVHRTVRLLAQITGAAAVVQYPTLARSTVRHVELVGLSAQRVLVVLITTTGRVEQRTVDVGFPLTSTEIESLHGVTNRLLAGRTMSEAASLLSALPEAVGRDLHGPAARLVSVLLETLVESPSSDRVATAGVANLAGVRSFSERIGPVVEALEEQVVLLRLFDELDTPAEVRVRIGGENESEGLRSASVVSIGYGTGDHILGGLGVVGPTAMDYPTTIAAVRAVARYVGTIVAGG